MPCGYVRSRDVPSARPNREFVPGAEIEVRHGGQPFYRYLISAE